MFKSTFIQISSHFIPQKPYVIGIIPHSIIQMKKLKHRKVKQHAPGYTVSNRARILIQVTSSDIRTVQKTSVNDSLQDTEDVLSIPSDSE